METDQKRLIGYVLNNPQQVLDLPRKLVRDRDSEIYDSLKERVLQDKDQSFESVADDTDKELNHIIGLSNEGMFSEKRFHELVNRLEQEYKRETTIELLDTALHTLVETEEDCKEVVNNLREELVKINTGDSNYKIKNTEELIEEWREYYEQEEEDKAELGFESLDEEIGGLRGTEFMIVMGDTGAGKTNLMLNMAENIMNQEMSVLYFSLEMSRFELMDRVIPIVGSHNASQLREKDLDEEELEETLEEMKHFDFRIADSGGIRSDDVISEIISKRAEDEVDVVMVDYLQRLADPRENYGSEVERLGAIARKLKDTALNMEVPIISPVQVDKSSSKSGEKRVENVAWSKDIANESDLALYIYDADEQENEDVPREKYIKVVKSRHSAMGTTIPVVFDQDNLRMMEHGHDGQTLEDITNKL